MPVSFSVPYQTVLWKVYSNTLRISNTKNKKMTMRRKKSKTSLLRLKSIAFCRVILKQPGCWECKKTLQMVLMKQSLLKMFYHSSLTWITFLEWELSPQLLYYYVRSINILTTTFCSSMRWKRVRSRNRQRLWLMLSLLSSRMES